MTARIDTDKSLDLIGDRIAELERVGARHDRPPEVSPRAIATLTGVIRSISTATGKMFVQEVVYGDSPPVEREIEPISVRFRAYPIPGVFYADLVGLNLVVGGADSDPVSAFDPIVVLRPDSVGNWIVYPMLRGDQTALNNGPRYEDPRQPDLHDRLDLVPRSSTWTAMAVYSLVALNATRVGGSDRPVPFSAGFGVDRLRGLLRSRFESCGFQHLGGFRWWRGDLYSPTFGVLCGKIIAFASIGACVPITSSDCACVDDDPPPNGGETCDTDPPGVDPQCLEPEGLACIYCLEPEDQCNCSIRQARSGCLPCTGYGQSTRSVARPGVRVTPVTRDIYHNRNTFFANGDSLEGSGEEPPEFGLGGTEGNIQYYLSNFFGWYHPVFPDPTYGGFFQRKDCCTYVCHWSGAFAQGGWNVECNPVLKTPHTPEEPRLFTVRQQNRFPALVTFRLSRIDADCFSHLDQRCMTGGPDPEHDWDHPNDTEPRLIALDTIQINLNLSIKGKPKYLRRSESWLGLANAALTALGANVEQLSAPGHLRLNGLEGTALNLWRHTQEWQCADAPLVGQVFVRPYGTTCDFPADLVIQQTDIHLRASAMPKGDVDSGGGSPDDKFDLLIRATLDVELFLVARLRPGWENIGTRIKIQAPPKPPGTITDDGVLTALNVDWSQFELDPGTDTLTLTNALDADGVSVPAAEGDFTISKIQTTDLTIANWTAGEIASVDYKIVGPGCPGRFVRADVDPCDTGLRSPHRFASVFTLDEDGRAHEVPLHLSWRGLLHSRPWSLVASPKYRPCRPMHECCDLLHALNGTLIPAEVWDTSDIEGEQRNSGDAVIFLQDDPNIICDCNPEE